MPNLDDLRAWKRVEQGPDERFGQGVGVAILLRALLALEQGVGAAAALIGDEPGLSGPFLQSGNQTLGQVRRRAGRGLELNRAGAETDQANIFLQVQLETDVAPLSRQRHDLFEGCG